MKLTFADVFKIKVIYKSGASHEFEAYSFNVTGNTVRWDAVSDSNRPLVIGPDDIAAVYQVGYRRKLVLKKNATD